MIYIFISRNRFARGKNKIKSVFKSVQKSAFRWFYGIPDILQYFGKGTSDFWPTKIFFLKIKIVTKNLAKNQNFGEKSKFWVKNKTFAQKSKFWSKIKLLLKNQNFGQKSKFWSTIVILVKNCYFGQKLLFWSKIFILVKNFYFGQKS